MPTTAEQGFPSVDFTHWVGYSAAPGVPPKIVQTWVEALNTAMKDPEVLEGLKKAGMVPGFLGGKDYDDFLLKNLDLLKNVATRAGIKE